MRTIGDRIREAATRACVALSGLLPHRVRHLGVAGGAGQVLIPIPSGYIAYWEIYEPGATWCSKTGLLVELTFSEARAIERRDVFRTGFLEPVRATLHNSSAFLLCVSGDQTLYRRFIVPPGGGEPKFAAHLVRKFDERRGWKTLRLASAPEEIRVYEESLDLIPSMG